MLNTHLQTPQKNQTKNPTAQTHETAYFEKAIPEKQILFFLIYKLNPVRIFGEAVYLGQARKDAAVHP